MGKTIRILLQCSIPYAEDDWHVGRFSLLRDELSAIGEVVARNREPDERGDDPVLSKIGRSKFDEVWLFGVDGGSGLSARDCAAINAFQREGGGLLTTRDHQNMGMWLRQIEGVGNAHFFHDSAFAEYDPSRCCRDDEDTPSISWPNYHSGRNGDFQRIIAVQPRHPLIRGVEYFPAHPHEGAVGVPLGESRASSVARGQSVATGREF